MFRLLFLNKLKHKKRFPNPRSGKFYPLQPGRDVLRGYRYYGHFFEIFMFGLYEKEIIPARRDPAYMKVGSRLNGSFLNHITPRWDDILIQLL